MACTCQANRFLESRATAAEDCHKRRAMVAAECSDNADGKCDCYHDVSEGEEYDAG